MNDELKKMTPDRGEIVIYQGPEGLPAMEVRLDRETVWLDAHQMAALFGRDRTVIVRHIRNVYATGELERKTTCAKNAQVAADGKLRQMDIYRRQSLTAKTDCILSFWKMITRKNNGAGGGMVSVRQTPCGATY